MPPQVIYQQKKFLIFECEAFDGVIQYKIKDLDSQKTSELQVIKITSVCSNSTSQSQTENKTSNSSKIDESVANYYASLLSKKSSN